MLVLGIVLTVGLIVLAWQWGAGPTRRRIARVAFALSLLMWWTAAQPEQQQPGEAPLDVFFFLLAIALGLGLVITRLRRVKAGTWPASSPAVGGLDT